MNNYVDALLLVLPATDLSGVDKLMFGSGKRISTPFLEMTFQLQEGITLRRVLIQSVLLRFIRFLHHQLGMIQNFL